MNKKIINIDISLDIFEINPYIIMASYNMAL
jgi:hypothetical protein